MKKLSLEEAHVEPSNDSHIKLDKGLIGVPSRVFDAKNLFSGSEEIGVIHEGSMYRLRVTRSGKLILTK